MFKAKHIMTKDVISVRKDTPIYQCLELMAKHKVAGIPVVEDDMSLVGFISEKDVLHLFYARTDQEEKQSRILLHNLQFISMRTRACWTFVTFWQKTSSEESRSHQKEN